MIQTMATAKSDHTFISLIKSWVLSVKESFIANPPDQIELPLVD